MPKQLNVNLAFNADIGNAKSQIQELQGLLNKIAYTGQKSSGSGAMSTQIKQAASAAKELQYHLNNAFNSTTGNFDLSRLDKSLKTSGTNISNLSTQLLGAGDAGQEAFVKLAQSISMADQPMLRINAKVREFGTTLKNAARWQLSSSILHGFMGTINSAVGYAKDLNSSLTDIRIVTGMNTDEMSKFANEANKAAKALSTTTTDYTKASLIYFQQGLSEEEVKARTDITVKMANASGASAQAVSDQLTSIWNNFADGSQSLEHYADVLVRLGADTASSTDEIANGMQKFASVAGQIGLSYEYAASALATVTATTRESADVVGNAFKTLFARIQGLKMGETLDDGVTLNKYSQGLKAIGVDILDQNGQLKDMNTILDEIGAKWKNLDRVQQTSLAQTVAGVRQYTQFASLMNNWEYFQENLARASSSEGSLTQQAEIYADSWEAARKRVKAAKEDIFNDLLDDKLFIAFNNGFANALNGVNAFIEGIGGLKGVIAGVSGIFMMNFANKIPRVIEDLKYNFTLLTKGSEQAYQMINKQMQETTQKAFEANKIDPNSSQGIAIDQANKLSAAKLKLASINNELTDSERQQYQTTLNLIQADQQKIISSKQKVEQIQQEITSQTQTNQSQFGLNYENYLNTNILEPLADAQSSVHNLVSDILSSLQFNEPSIAGASGVDFVKGYATIFEQINQKVIETNGNFKELSSSNFSINITEQLEYISTAFNVLKDNSKDLFKSLESGKISTQNFEEVKSAILSIINTIPKSIQQVDGLKQAISSIKSAKSAEDLVNSFDKLNLALDNVVIKGKDVQRVFSDMTKTGGGKPEAIVSGMRTIAQESDNAEKSLNRVNQQLNAFSPVHVLTAGQAIGKLAGASTSTIMGINSLVSAFRTLGDESQNAYTRISGFILGIGMSIPQLTMAFSALSNVYNQYILAALADAEISKSLNDYISLLTKARMGGVMALNAQQAAAVKAAIAKSRDKKLTKEQTAALLEQTLAENGVKNTKLANIIASKIAQAETIKETIAQRGLIAALKEYIALKLATSPTTFIATAAIAAVATLTARLIYLSKAGERSAKKINELAEQSKKSKEEVKQLEDSLKSLQDRMDELRNKGPLTITEQEELNKLILEEASLQRQLAIKQRMADLDAKASASNFASGYKDVANDLKQDVREADVDAAVGSGWRNDQNSIEDVPYKSYTILSDMLKSQKERQYDLLNQINKEELGFERRNALEKQYENISKAIEYNEKEIEKAKINFDASMAKIGREYGETLENALYNFSDWLKLNPEKTSEEITKELQESRIPEMQKSLFGEDYKSMIYKSLSGIQKIEDEKDIANGLETTTDQIQNLIKQNANIDDAATLIAQNFSEETKKQILSLGFLPDDYAKMLFEDYSSKIKVYQDAFKNEQKSFNDFYDEIIKQGISISDLLLLTPEEIASIAAAEEPLIEILNLLLKIKAAKIEGLGTDNLVSDATKQREVLKEIRDGKTTLSAEDFEKIPENLRKSFIELENGEFLLTDNVDEFTENLDNQIEAPLEQYIQDQQRITQASNLKDNEGFAGATRDFQKISGDNTIINGYSGQEYINLVNELLGTTYENASDAAQAMEQFWESGQAAADTSVQSDKLAKMTDNIAELNKLFKEGMIDEQQYVEQLTRINAQDIEKYGFDSGEINNEAKKYAGDAYSKYKEDQTKLQEYQDKLSDAQKRNDEVGIRSNEAAIRALNNRINTEKKEIEQAKAIAIAHQRLQRGVDSLSKNWKNWSKELKNSGKNSEEYKKAAEGTKEVLSDMLNLDMSDISDEFATSAKTMELMGRVANNDMDAIDELRAHAQEELLINIVAKDEAIPALQTALNELPDNVEIGTRVNTEESIGALQTLLAEGKITAEELTKALNMIGWNPNIEYKSMTVGALKTMKYSGTVGVGEAAVPFNSEAYSDDNEVVQIPILTSATYTGGGGSVTPPKPSSSGGGGGNKRKTHDAKSDIDKTRYHTITNQLEDLKASYDDVNEAKDRAFGLERIKGIEDEIKATDDLIKKQKEYVDAISKNLPIDKETMIAYYKELIGGNIDFDELGNISNFDEIQDRMFDKYNSMANKELDDETWEVFEKKYEKLEKYIEQYEETYDLLRDQEQEYQDLLNQRVDLELEKVQQQIELKINLADDGLKLLDYKLEKLDNNAKKAAEAIGLMVDKSNQLYAEMMANREGLEKALGLTLSENDIVKIINGDFDVSTITNKADMFTNDQIEAIKEYRDNLLDLNSEFDDIRQQIEDKVMQTFDELSEKVDDGISKFDHYNNVLQTYRDIIDLVGKDTLRISDSLLQALGDQQFNTAIDNVKATKETYLEIQKAAEKARVEYDKAVKTEDEHLIDYWENVYKQLEDKMNEAQENFLTAWKESLDSLANQFENSMNDIVDRFNKAIYKVGGLEGLSKDFSMQRENADQMLDDYEKIYELSKLGRNIEKTIDDTKNIGGKQKLKKLLEDINKLQANGNEMSKYDLEYLQKTYDLRVAELELEESRLAKNVVRLQKDNEGNWSYIYTQNTDAVDQAQQKYEDALFAMQDLSSNYIDEMSEKLISTSQEMAEALANLRIQDYASADDYYAKVEEVTNKYQKQLEIQQNELQKALDNNKVLYDEDMTNYANNINEKYRLAEDFVTGFNKSILGQLMDSESSTADFNDLIKDSTDAMFAEIIQASEQYYKRLQEAMDTAMGENNIFSDNLQENIQDIKDASNSAVDDVVEMADTMTEKFGEATDSVIAWQETYGSAMESIIESNLRVIESFNEMLKALSLEDIDITYNIAGKGRADSISAFDTGGYTGAWGSTGKLALLHEKEMVLNDQDTSNLLDIINITRDIIGVIDMNARQAQSGFGSSFAPGRIMQRSDSILEQNVHITAEFPDATDHNELVAAFDTLINRASQYANRK